MRKPFLKDYPLTQEFNDPCCRKSYKKYNIQGHNGVDFGLPCETKLVSPISGKVIEVEDEGDRGYGKYLKIENSTEGVVLAHLSQIQVLPGQRVDQGQHLGLSGTTGNSTGCHLHFGYYRFPRDRSNGFLGYIDPMPYFTDGGILPLPEEDMLPYLKTLFQERNLNPDDEPAVREFFQKSLDFDNLKKDKENGEIKVRELEEKLAALQSPAEAPKTVNSPLRRLIDQLVNFVAKIAIKI